ncbi:MAG: DNA primase, partial [Gammaproteobacteria bacterium]
DPERRRALVRAGLLVEKAHGRLYDRFRDRILFPIRDRRGRVVAFGGRVLDEGTPKYLNSPESPIFHKGRILYGLYEARQAHRRLDRVLVVEGYMDVVALAQHGIRNAVATLGTSTTTEHVEQLFRVTDEIVFCFDGDAAGRAAAWRAAENALPALRAPKQARFLFLPEGEDPDSRVRARGREGFLQDIEGALPFSDFFFRHLGEGTDLSTAEGRARLAALARPRIERIPPGPFREAMAARLAELTRLPARRTPRPGSRPRPRRQEGRTRPVREAIRLLLHHPFLARELAHPPPRDERLPGLPLLAELVDFIVQSPHLPSTGALLEHFREHPEGPALWKLAERPPKIPEGGELPEFLGFLSLIERELEARHLQERLAHLTARPPSSLSPEEAEELRTLLACQANIRTR